MTKRDEGKILAFFKTLIRRLALVMALPVGGAVFFVLYVFATVASYEQLDNMKNWRVRTPI